MEAQQWCDNRSNRAEMAKILAQPKYIGVPERILIEPLQGQYTMGDGQANINNFNQGPLFWRDSRGSVSYPYKSHDLWFLTESIRWGFLPRNTPTKAWIDRVNREDIWKEAARQLGVAANQIPSSTSRGVETFFDGVKFDPANPQAYLRSLKIKKV